MKTFFQNVLHLGIALYELKIVMENLIIHHTLNIFSLISSSVSTALQSSIGRYLEYPKQEQNSSLLMDIILQNYLQNFKSKFGFLNNILRIWVNY